MKALDLVWLLCAACHTSTAPLAPVDTEIPGTSSGTASEGAEGAVLRNVAELARAEQHACARLIDGSVHCWGDNRAGQSDPAGRPSTTGRVTIAGVHGARALAVGDAFSCAVDGDRALRCWGRDPLTASGRDPVTFTPSRPLARDVHTVAAGKRLLCAVHGPDRTLYCRGQLEPDIYGAQQFAPTVPTRVPARPLTEPVRLSGAPVTRVAQLVAGDYHVCARRDTGEVLCLGYGRTGALGLADGQTSADARPVAGIRARELIAYDDRTCARDADGRVSCWGEGEVFTPQKQKECGAAWVNSRCEWRANRLICRDISLDESVVQVAPIAEMPPLAVDPDGGVEWLAPDGEPYLTTEWLASRDSLCAEFQPDNGDEEVRCWLTPTAMSAARGREACTGEGTMGPLARAPAFPLTAYAEARMYAFGTSRAISCADSLISRAGRTTCPDLHRRGVRLSPVQATEVLQWVNDEQRYARDIFTCFLPHHEIIFFDANRLIVARLSICFKCSTLSGWPAIPAQRRASTNIFKAMDKLQGLCQTLGVPHCDGKIPRW